MLPSTRSLLTRSLLLVFLAPSLLAATRTWTGANGLLWSDAGNWGGTAPVAGDDLIFPNGASNLTNTNNLAVGTLIQSILIADEYRLNGNAIVIGAGGITANTLGTPVISIPLQLGAAQTWTNIHAPFTELALSGVVDLNGFALALGGSSYGRITGKISGSGSITKGGASSWLLSGDNDYVGPTVINSGGVSAQHANAFGLADNTLANGTIVNDGSIGMGTPTLAPEYFQFHGVSSLVNGSFATLTGTVELSDGTTQLYTDIADMVFNGVVTGAAGVRLTGEGWVVFTNPGNEFTGSIVMDSPVTLRLGADDVIPPGKAISINGFAKVELEGRTLSIASLAGQGFVRLGSGGILTVSGPGTTTFTGTILDSGTVRLTGGDLTLIGNNTFTGVALNDSGILRILGGSFTAPLTQSAGTFGLANNATVGAATIQGGAFAPGLSGNGLGNSGNLFLGPGALYLEPINSSASGAFGRVDVTGTVSINGSTLVLSGAASGIVGGSQLTIVANDGSDPVIGTFDGLPEGAAIPNGPGNLTYSISYEGGTGNDIVLNASALTSTSLTSAPNPANSGESVTLIATVVSLLAGTPTGTVTFRDGATVLAAVPLSGNTANFATSSLSVGSHSITATYDGDSSFLPSVSAPTTQIVASVVPVPMLDPRALALLVTLLAAFGAALLVRR